MTQAEKDIIIKQAMTRCKDILIDAFQKAELTTRMIGVINDVDNNVKFNLTLERQLS